MKRRYKGLVFASVLLRIVAIVVVVAGVGLTLWSLAESGRSQVLRISAIVDIGISLLIGIGFYSFGEFISYVLEADLKGKSEDED